MKDTLTRENGGMYSIKEKLSVSESRITEENNTLESMKVTTGQFIDELTDLTKRTNNTTAYICKDVAADCQEKQEYIQRHMSQQKSENIRLNKELLELKATNDDFKNTIANCQNKLNELQSKIGVNFSKIN